MPVSVALSASSFPILIIAGGGGLPLKLADILGARAQVCALRGFASPDTLAAAAIQVPFGRFGAMIDFGRRARARHVIFVGGLARPAAYDLDLDVYSKTNLAPDVFYKGDDAALRAISDLFAKAGLTTLGVLDVAPTLAMPAGALTQHAMDERARADWERGFTVAKALGAVDVGQAVVVQQGLVLALEGVEGTDALIARSARLKRPGPAPILVKAAKPNQDMRLDVPTFGPQTIASLETAGFAGATLQAGKTMLVDRETCVDAAEQAGLFLQGFVA